MVSKTGFLMKFCNLIVVFDVPLAFLTVDNKCLLKNGLLYLLILRTSYVFMHF